MSTCDGIVNATVRPRNIVNAIAEDDNGPVDCLLSHWSEWTPCSVSCGVGKSEKYRHILRQGVNGGTPCPSKKIVKRRKCYAPPC